MCSLEAFMDLLEVQGIICVKEGSVVRAPQQCKLWLETKNKEESFVNFLHFEVPTWFRDIYTQIIPLVRWEALTQNPAVWED